MRLVDEVDTLRFVTYLAPSLPLQLFEFIVERVGRRLDLPVRVAAETLASGPPAGTTDPFTAGVTDVAFVCSPSYLRMASLSPPPVRLVSAAPVFDDPRAKGLPVYFADVIVGRSRGVKVFDDLRGTVWAYNDGASLSGWYCLLDQLSRRGLSLDYFHDCVASGSHLASINAVARGSVDAAAIDSNVLAHLRRAAPDRLRDIRVLETWGPFPIQPVVAASHLPRSLHADLAAALLTIEPVPRFGFRGFHVVDDAFYATERERLARTSTEFSARR
jgi:ABC-type phosphate/phosphonate transport system substrate-binding protein